MSNTRSNHRNNMDQSSEQRLPEVSGQQPVGTQLQTSNLVQFEMVKRLLRGQQEHLLEALQLQRQANQQQQFQPMYETTFSALRQDQVENLQRVAGSGERTEEVRSTSLPSCNSRNSVVQSQVPQGGLRWSLEVPFGVRRKTSRPLTILVEANIGCGKTTFTKNFLKNKEILTLLEPLEEYRNVAGVNLLEKMYTDPFRYAYQFQHHAIMLMKNMHSVRTLLPTKIMDRSIFSCKCFIEARRRIGGFEDVEAFLLTQCIDNFTKDSHDFEVDLIVYLRLPPEEPFSRVRSRARNEEEEVPLEYLRTLHEVHEDWLVREKFSTPLAPVLILDAELTADEVISNFCEVMCV